MNDQSHDTISLNQEKAVRRFSAFGKEVTQELPIDDYKNTLQSHLSSSFHTGWLPNIVKYFSVTGDRAQAVIILPPEISLILWGQYEGANANHYELAQPWRVIIADFKDNLFFGARMFYSPYEPFSPETQLYHVNLPNINCQGYRGNGVGWVCLYHRDNDKQQKMSWAEKIAYAVDRCSGQEAYNDANMSETDGPRFYSKNKYPKHTYDPHEWERKSSEDGISWTLDPSTWIPVLVAGPDQQDKHYTNGTPLTIAMACEGKYQAYYRDAKNTPYSYQLDRQGKSSKEQKDAQNGFSAFAKSFVAKSTTSVAVKPLLVHVDPSHGQLRECRTCLEDKPLSSYLRSNSVNCNPCLKEARLRKRQEKAQQKAKEASMTMGAANSAES